jgi:beta-glucosidase
MTPPAARLVVPAIRWDAEDRFEKARAAAFAELDLGVGGFILFGGPAAEVATLTRDLANHAGRPLLFAADLERGAGQQFTGLTEVPPPGALGRLEDLAAVRRAGMVTAREARSLGITLVLAPVADLDSEAANPIIQSRSFGSDPEAVSRAVAAWVEGCRAGGCGACLKHFPGHDRTTRDSHPELPAVDATPDQLAADLLPFRAGIDAGAEAVMTAHVRYRAIDPVEPATYSRPVIDLLRSDLAFGGLVVSDALIMAGANRKGGPGAAALAAVSAGVDLLLYPQDPAGTVDALHRATANGAISEARLQDAVVRLDSLCAGGATGPAVDAADGTWAAAVADRVLSQGLVRGSAPRLEGPLAVTVIDDDHGGPFPPGSTQWVEDGVAGMAGPDPRTVVLLFAEPRGWKERAGLSEAARSDVAAAAEDAALVVVFGHPRLAADVPGSAPVLVAWHRQRLMQDAVIRWIESRR